MARRVVPPSGLRTVRSTALRLADLQKQRKAALYRSPGQPKSGLSPSYESMIASCESEMLSALGRFSDLGLLPKDLEALWNTFLDAPLDSKEGSRAMTELIAFCKDLPAEAEK